MSYYGIGIYKPKFSENIGTLWRSGYNFGANFLFVIGRRYHKHPADTVKAARHIPLYEYNDYDEFKSNLPVGCEVVFIEQTTKARMLPNINHPKCAAYVLGGEDCGIPEDLMFGHQVIAIDSHYCLNVAVAGSIVMYDRTTCRPPAQARSSRVRGGAGHK